MFFIIPKNPRCTSPPHPLFKNFIGNVLTDPDFLAVKQSKRMEIGTFRYLEHQFSLHPISILSFTCSAEKWLEQQAKTWLFFAQVDRSRSHFANNAK